MCDTLCVIGEGRGIFAKNSDRPLGEVQLVSALPGRRAGGRVRTQYVELSDGGAAATLLARPTWLWGAEHGVNEHRLAVGNEAVSTTVDAAAAPEALIGMDLVRLALERAGNAEEGVGVIGDLLAGVGQGGPATPGGGAYCSSFLLADPTSGWILETAGSSWAAKPVSAAAISNRLSLRADWTRGSPDLSPGDDVDVWRSPGEPTGHADRRLAAAAAFLGARDLAGLGPADVVGHLRDHGAGPWGAPGSGDRPQPPPGPLLPDFTGISVCMHVRGSTVTSSSMVVELPSDPDAVMRAWVAPGSPCVTAYLPVRPAQGMLPPAVPGALSDEAVWRQVSALRDRVERAPEAIADVRAVLDPLEAEVWAEADAIAAHPGRWGSATARWGARFSGALRRLVDAGD